MNLLKHAPLLALLVLALTPATSQARDLDSKAQARTAAIHWLSGLIRNYQEQVRDRQRLMDRPQSPVYSRQLQSMSVPAVKHILWLWKRRAGVAWRQFRQVPHKNLWLCIHRGEAAWDNPGVDWLGNPSKYYDGLQMDLDFQREYAGWLLRKKGTGNHWTPLEQMWVAEIAYKHSGYSLSWLRFKWPNSSLSCT